MSRSSKRAASKWQRFRQRDKFVREASRLDLRSRSYFKLEELDRHYGLLTPGLLILDLGAAPGGWSQYARTKTGKASNVVAVDINPMKPIDGVQFIQLDLADVDAVQKLANYLKQRQVDVVLSDMAPNITGNSAIDSRNYFDLYAAIFKICGAVLKESGSLVFKFFQTDETPVLKKRCQLAFDSCRIYKPKPSRSHSQESYMVALGFRSHLADLLSTMQ